MAYTFRKDNKRKVITVKAVSPAVATDIKKRLINLVKNLHRATRQVTEGTDASNILYWSPCPTWPVLLCYL